MERGVIGSGGMDKSKVGPRGPSQGKGALREASMGTPFLTPARFPGQSCPCLPTFSNLPRTVVSGQSCLCVTWPIT